MIDRGLKNRYCFGGKTALPIDAGVSQSGKAGGSSLHFLNRTHCREKRPRVRGLPVHQLTQR